MSIIAKSFSAILMAIMLSTPLARAGVPEDVVELQHEWERIKYQAPAAEREKEFERLLKRAERVTAQQPDRAEALIWQAIIESTYAGAKGGLGALGHAKNAKKTLERAIEIDPGALDGSAYTSLGSLYYQVPGWPIGFGDNKKAAEFLKRGLAINPNGIDPNYFYGDFLFRTGDLAGAEQSLRKAMQAPARPGRQIADEGRRQEIRQLFEKIAAKRK